MHSLRRLERSLTWRRVGCAIRGLVRGIEGCIGSGSELTGSSGYDAVGRVDGCDSLGPGELVVVPAAWHRVVWTRVVWYVWPVGLLLLAWTAGLLARSRARGNVDDTSTGLLVLVPLVVVVGLVYQCWRSWRMGASLCRVELPTELADEWDLVSQPWFERVLANFVLVSGDGKGLEVWCQRETVSLRELDVDRRDGSLLAGRSGSTTDVVVVTEAATLAPFWNKGPDVQPGSDPTLGFNVLGPAGGTRFTGATLYPIGQTTTWVPSSIPAVRAPTWLTFTPRLQYLP